MQASSFPITSVECPKCGKHSVVNHQEGIYHCLNCDAHWNLNAAEHAEPEENPVPFLFGAGIFILTLLIFI